MALSVQNQITNINYPTMGRKGDAEVGNKKRADTNYRLDDEERMTADE